MDYTLKVLKTRMPNFTDVVNEIDSYLQETTKSTIKFLDEHPGIATLLSPTTVTRRVAQKHVDELINYR